MKKGRELKIGSRKRTIDCCQFIVSEITNWMRRIDVVDQQGPLSTGAKEDELKPVALLWAVGPHL